LRLIKLRKWVFIREIDARKILYAQTIVGECVINQKTPGSGCGAVGRAVASGTRLA